MNKFRFFLQLLALVFFAAAFTMVAQAQATRTWVSGVGDDVNPCSRTAPCKTFAGAISKTATNGEINCLDPGGYGAVTITKSITIDCEDTQGSILASLTNGVILNGAGIDVRLRGLSINGAGNGINGIRVLNSGNNKLTLEEVVIFGFSTHGISIESNGGTFKLVMKDSTIRNNTGNGINTFLSGVATATVSVENSLLAFNGIGLNLGLATNGTIQNSTVDSNTTGIQASGNTSILAVKNNVITHNTTGVLAGSSATIRIGGNMITGNGTGLSGSNIFTWGGNFVDGNTSNGTNNGAAAVQ
ncbi:right-handed parallel beta-helix repeat-containing protein [soil metagenome]